MRRSSLTTKLILAVLPLVVALGGLLTITVRDGQRNVDQARRGAELGSTWEPLITTMRSIETERRVSASGDTDEIARARRATNQLMVEMDTALRRMGDQRPVLAQLGQALSSLSVARLAVDTGATGGRSADDSFNTAQAELVASGSLLPAEAGERALARDLTAVAALAEVEQRSIVAVNGLQALGNGPGTPGNVERLLAQLDAVDASVSQFRATASDEWTQALRQIGFARTVDDIRRSLVQSATVAELAQLTESVALVANLRDDLARDIVATADSNASAIAQETLIRVVVIALAVLLALVLAGIQTRKITRRIREVSRAARDVSSVRLPVLVEALNDPQGLVALPEFQQIDDTGSDELSELAASFNSLQDTLSQVASEQIEVLRRGVSDIFVTMARRNRSLVDRQLSLLDELEASVDDPTVLADYYRLDQLATRMRRNAESLLVLANADSAQRRGRSAGVDDVVRAAIGEVEDYQRVDIASLEHLNLRGTAVADLAHLLAELLENATAYSPPDSRVQITGDLAEAEDEYRLLIMDDGMGILPDRLEALNQLLSAPPVIGLSVEPTLGMSVVSLLAAKHGAQVSLSSTGSGTVVKVVLPSTLFERRATERNLHLDPSPPAGLDLRTSSSRPPDTGQSTGGPQHPSEHNDQSSGAPANPLELRLPDAFVEEQTRTADEAFHVQPLDEDRLSLELSEFMDEHSGPVGTEVAPEEPLSWDAELVFEYRGASPAEPEPAPQPAPQPQFEYPEDEVGSVEPIVESSAPSAPALPKLPSLPAQPAPLSSLAPPSGPVLGSPPAPAGSPLSAPSGHQPVPPPTAPSLPVDEVLPRREITTQLPVTPAPPLTGGLPVRSRPEPVTSSDTEDEGRSPIAPVGPPGALKAALSAFDAGRREGHHHTRDDASPQDAAVEDGTS